RGPPALLGPSRAGCRPRTAAGVCHDACMSDSPRTTDPSAEQIRTVLDGRWGEVRQQMRADPDFPVAVPNLELGLEEHRARTLELCRTLAHGDFVLGAVPPEQGGTGELGRAITGLEMLGHGDLSVMVKA